MVPLFNRNARAFVVRQPEKKCVFVSASLERAIPEQQPEQKAAKTTDQGVSLRGRAGVAGGEGGERQPGKCLCISKVKL